MQCVGFTLLAAAFSAGLVRLLTSPSPGLSQRLLNGTLPRALGKYSYAIYLCHVPARELLTVAGWHPGFSTTAYGLRIVEQFGGTIWLESEVGKGSCFYFTVPSPP